MAVALPSFRPFTQGLIHRSDPSFTPQQRFNTARFTPSGPTAVNKTLGIISNLTLKDMGYYYGPISWYSIEFYIKFNRQTSMKCNSVSIKSPQTTTQTTDPVCFFFFCEAVIFQRDMMKAKKHSDWT